MEKAQKDAKFSGKRKKVGRDLEEEGEIAGPPRGDLLPEDARVLEDPLLERNGVGAGAEEEEGGAGAVGAYPELGVGARGVDLGG